MSKQIKREKKQRRHRRIRTKIKGNALCPRISVFRSNKYIYLQLIDDEKGRTLAAVDDHKIKPRKELLDRFSKKIATAFEAGRLLAEKALSKKIEKAVFDRGGYKYHGRVKAAAEGARQGGLKF